MKQRIRKFIFRVCPVLLVLSFPISFIKWGSADALHGEGIPIPSVIWDRKSNYDSNTDQEASLDHANEFIDFPSPLAFVLNPIVIVLSILIVYLTVELIIFMIHKIRKKKNTD